MNIFPDKKITKADQFCPILALWPNDKTTVTKGGKFARVLEFSGKDYSGLSPEVIDAYFHARKNFFEGLDSELTVMQHTHRMKIERTVKRGSFGNEMAGKISEVWNQQFKKSFRTRHFLIFVTDPDIMDQLQLLVRKKDEGETREGELLRKLDEAVKDIKRRLSDYGPKELAGDDLASYWGSLLNGRAVYQKAPDNGLLDGLLAGTTLRWPRRSRYQIYDSHKERYSAWLYIKKPAETSSQEMLETLFQLKQEFSIYQTMATVSKSAALSLLDDKEKNAQAFTKGAGMILLELAALREKIQAGSLSMISHRWAIEVFGDTRDELEDNISAVKNGIERFGYRAVRERINQEALFWSRFPEFQKLNCRQRTFTSENAAHFSTFATVGEGFESCSWGDSPVSVFKTKADSEYSFIYHVSPRNTALGNTMIIGGSEVGKTTLTNFLLSQCFRFPDFKVLGFDSLAGMRIFTSMHDGVYHDFSRKLAINPLQLEGTPANRSFLSQWFQMLTGRTDEKSVETIGRAILQAYELEKKQRTLENLALAFGGKEEGSIRNSLGPWLPGGNNDIYFNGVKDSLDFENPLVVFDMTTLLGVPEVLGPMAYYIFHKLYLIAKERGRYAVFVDELPKYLGSPLFVPKVEMMLQEIRKTDGIFIGAVQDAGAIFNHPSKDKFRANIGTYLLFPEPGADEKYYMGDLRLNRTEFDWIRKPHHREIMVKRKGGESVILNIDLSPLGRYLKVFDSSANSTKKMESLRRKTNDWKTLYIHGDRRRNADPDFAD